MSHNQGTGERSVEKHFAPWKALASASFIEPEADTVRLARSAISPASAASGGA
ncbi:hypothetical protein PH552_27535 [Rhizobium sp. CNPSo 3968]|uniref:hypothetical protein n=1 Tax=Rhizobium sp. CNPSo 3968 TaxID=3021408 RepID=UPI0013AE893D|nr:hypothetical protein [Rhizobium sp. CNPSo 3968]MDK4723111.1 hypothetical protein [Rhizobium sp. CNPSo 3968]